ncbi:cobalt ECF transporter T component CbiQ [Corynebacterium gerontici]|uniref:Cobalt transport protein CbiQ n=1 Tax=Corynebacterium gerontici TaxID=2079234 RepID=A0A3G6IZD8_9CORY|nr:cobalt ECF transporter T component CbiQ [Corynebacterium gerontici]AZA11057.1 Cobalt transport protein CbiQ [Corynebacterium gerontici]
MNPLERAAARSAWATRHVTEKAVLLLGLVVVCVAVPVGWVSCLIAATLLWVVIAANVPFRLLLALLLAPMMFILLSLVPLTVVISPEGLVWVPDGPSTAVMVFIRSMLATTATILFSLTTPMPEIFRWLRSIGVPQYLVHVLSLTYTMTSTLLTTARTMWESQAMRLGHSNRRRWIRSLADQAASLFVHAFSRARRLQEGLELRAEAGSMLVLSHTPTLRKSFVVGSVAWLGLLTALAVRGLPWVH